jgi:hypothetical protein
VADEKTWRCFRTEDKGQRSWPGEACGAASLVGAMLVSVLGLVRTVLAWLSPWLWSWLWWRGQGPVLAASLSGRGEGDRSVICLLPL